METQLVVPAGQASSHNAVSRRTTQLTGDSCNSHPTVESYLASQFSRDSGDSHPTVVDIELRQAWDGAWYPLVAQEGEPADTAGCCPVVDASFPR